MRNGLAPEEPNVGRKGIEEMIISPVGAICMKSEKRKDIRYSNNE